MAPYLVDTAETSVQHHSPDGVLERLVTRNASGHITKITEFHPDRSVRSITDIKDDLPHGDFSAFHPNGQIAEQGRYLHGKKNGRFVTNYVSGALWIEQHYLNDKLHGEVSYYDEQTGKRTLRMHLRHDVLHGVYETFDEQGQVTSSVTYNIGALESVPEGFDRKTGLSRIGFFRRYYAPWART
jgi:antitoxin component YwqK of YwqJK toxin-antitoxin module